MARRFAAAVLVSLGALSIHALEPEKLPSIESAKTAVDDAVALADTNAAKVAGANALFPKAADRQTAIADYLARLPYGKEIPLKPDPGAREVSAILEAKRDFWEKARYVMACTRGRLIGPDDGSCADVPAPAGGGADEARDLHQRIMLILDIQEDIERDKKEARVPRPKPDLMSERKEKLFQRLEARRAISK